MRNKLIIGIKRKLKNNAQNLNIKNMENDFHLFVKKPKLI